MMINIEKEQREIIIKEALSWQGTPYHPEGRVKGAGTDCGMYLLQVFENCGLIEHVEVPHYPQDWSLNEYEERYLQWVEKFAVKVDRDPIPGDIILHKFYNCVDHGGICIEDKTLIHSYLNEGVIQSEIRMFRKWQYGVYSFWDKVGD